jgi:hypothetical protein
MVGTPRFKLSALRSADLSELTVLRIFTAT